MAFYDKDGKEIELGAETPEVKALVDAAISEATSGLTTNRDEILGEKKTLQKKLDEMGETWKDLDPEAVRTIMERLENDEEAQLLAAGKMDEVIGRRMERVNADHTKQVDSFTSQLAERDTALGSANSRIKTLLVEGGMRQAAAELGVVASAIPDALARANNVFSVNDNGNLTAVEKDGTTIFGKDGKSSISPAEWLESMKERAPHWFPAPSGAGAQGGGGGKGGIHTITREQARDPAVYRAAKEVAQKAGVELKIAS